MFKQASIFVLILSIHINGNAFAHGVHKAGEDSLHSTKSDVVIPTPAPSITVSTANQNHSHDPSCGHPISGQIEETGRSLMTSCLGPNQNDIRERVQSGADDKISRDQAICACFEKENNSYRPTFIAERDRIRNNSNLMENFKQFDGHQSIKQAGISGKGAALRSGMALNILTIAGDNSQTSVDVAANLGVSDALGAQELADSAVVSNAKKVTLSQSQELTKAPSKNTPKVPAPPAPQGLSSLDPNYFKDNTDDKNCVSFQEFFVFNQVPADNVFYSFMDEQKKFVPSEWNYNTLKAELSRRTQGKVFNLQEMLEQDNAGKSTFTQEERMGIYSIVSRMRFLNSNTVFKNLFLINGSGDDHILEHQQKLFSQMKNHLDVPSVKNCVTKAGKCRKEYTEDSSFLTFLKNAREAVVDEESLKAIHKKGEEEMADFNRQQHEEGLRSPMSRPVYSLWYQNNLDKGNCDNEKFSVLECTIGWGKYCGGLPDAYNESTSPFAAGVETHLNEIYEPDFNLNEPYKAFVNFACNKKRGPEPGLIFSEFKQKFCTKNKSDGLCRPENRAKLVAKYLETNDSLTANNGVEIDATDSASLANFLKSVPVPSLTNEQAERLISQSSRNAQDGSPRNFNLARHGEAPTNGTSTSLADFRAGQSRVANSPAINGANPSVASTTNFERSSTTTGFDSSPVFAAASSNPSISQSTTFSPTPQVQRALEENRAETGDLKQKISEISTERDQVIRQNPSDDRIGRFDSELASLRNDLKNSENRYLSLLEKIATEKKVAQAVSSPATASSPNLNADSNASRSFIQGPSASRNPASSDSKPGQISAPQNNNLSTASALASFSFGRGASATIKSLQINGALLDARKSSNAESGLVVSSSPKIENQVRIPVPADVYNLVESGNSEAIRTYASKKLSEANSNEDRVFLQVNVDGSINNRNLELIAVKQANGEYKFFTPDQVASTDLRQNRSPDTIVEPTAKAQPNWRLQRLRHIVGP